MIPISAKFAAKGTPSYAPHVNFPCVQVACMNILVRLIPSTPPPPPAPDPQKFFKPIFLQFQILRKTVDATCTEEIVPGHGMVYNSLSSLMEGMPAYRNPRNVLSPLELGTWTTCVLCKRAKKGCVR